MYSIDSVYQVKKDKSFINTTILLIIDLTHLR